MAEHAACHQCRLPFDGSDRAPMLLICAHSLCLSCVAKLPLPLTCPMCRMETPGPPTELKKNFALLAALPRLLPSKAHEMCMECRAPAFLFCASCGCLCKGCSTKIHAFKSFSAHTVVSIDEMPSVQIALCAEHGEKALLFCPCNSSLICLLCRDYGKHKGHYNVMTLADAASHRVQALNDLILKADAAQRIDCVTSAIIAEQELLKQEATKAREQLTDYFRDAYQILGDYEKQMMSLVDEEEKKLNKGFIQQRFEIARACAALKAVKAQALKICASSQVQILRAPEIQFPEIRLLSEPCASRAEFDICLPEIPELAIDLISDAFTEKEDMVALSGRLKGLALCVGERLDVCDAEGKWHTAVILETQGASFLVFYEDLECEEWLTLGMQRFAALGTYSSLSASTNVATTTTAASFAYSSSSSSSSSLPNNTNSLPAPLSPTNKGEELEVLDC